MSLSSSCTDLCNKMDNRTVEISNNTQSPFLEEHSVRLGAVQHCLSMPDDESGASLPSRRHSRNYREGWWLFRWASCCMEVGTGNRRTMTWFQCQRLRLAEMAVEMEKNPDFAMFLAFRVDRFLFWFIMIGYNCSIIIIFASQASKDPVLSFS